MNNRIKKLINSLHKITSLLYKDTNHNDYVLIGSLSLLGYLEQSKRNINNISIMLASPDLDIYLKNDPNRTDNLYEKYGKGSPYNIETGNYLDIVSPKTATLPKNWQNRLIPISFDNTTVHCLDPHDAAISKLIRFKEHDVEWIKNGITLEIFNPQELENLIKTEINEYSILEKLNFIFEDCGLPPIQDIFDYVKGEEYAIGNDYHYELQTKWKNGLYLSQIIDLNKDKAIQSHEHKHHHEIEQIISDFETKILLSKPQNSQMKLK